MTKLHGLGTALITPFDKEGMVDYAALERLLDHQIRARVDYICVLGTTGEPATLTPEEYQLVARHIVDYVGGRIPLVLGVGGNCTAAVVARLKAESEWIGRHFEAILSVCPYYNKPNQEGLYRHFSAIAEASPVPVLLYNVPGRTGVNLLPKTVERIWENNPDKIVGIKEASGKLAQMQELIERSHKRWLVISGDDGLACALMQAGGDGLISVAANAFPEDFHHIVHHQDEALQNRYQEMIGLLFCEGSPAGIKSVLCQRGEIENIVRLPLVTNTRKVQDQIKSQLDLLAQLD